MSPKAGKENIVAHCEFAYDSQLYNLAPREQRDSLLSSMQSCVDDVKLWRRKTSSNSMKEKLKHCSLILKTHQTVHSQSKLVKIIFDFQDQSGI